jgi:hypothetical protein
MMIDGFEILRPNSTRPNAERIIFCDGTDNRIFRAETDLELSHWRPNRTPVEYRAGTSTEICFRFLDDSHSKSWTVAVNNHVDVDGILSVYVLLHSAHALSHRQVIIEAAQIGDFWGWGEDPAQRLFQGITALFNSGLDDQGIFEEAFRRVPTLIDGSDPDIEKINQLLAPLRHGVELLDRRRICRSLIGPRLAHYVIPLAVAGDDDERVSYVPDFNEAVSWNALLWPQVRARWDAQRVCLVSAERISGWFHDLWFPGYLWADTEGLWRVPNFTFFEGMRHYELADPRLIEAFKALQRRETASGQWALGGTPLPFGNELQSRFPLVGRFSKDFEKSAISQLPPDVVAKALEGLFD